MTSEAIHKIFSLQAADEPAFTAMALAVFRFQYQHNPLYRAYADALHTDVAAVSSMEQIPFLPIRFFKSHAVQTTVFTPELVFESSGTTTTINSRHLVKEAGLYSRSFLTAFEQRYGPVKDWCIIGLLPSYLERGHSSLVYMVDKLVGLSDHPQSGFYLYEHQRLFEVLQQLEAAGQKTILFGVTFALLDFAEAFSLPLQHTIIMETGGMKGRREELVRPAVHALLNGSFHTSGIHAEYGMTELLSQAYSGGDGLFSCPPWMKVLLRDEEDPLTVHKKPASGKKPVSGAINVIDLANIYSCSFIATDDAGRLYADEQFEVLGRLDNSDLRGCSLLVI